MKYEVKKFKYKSLKINKVHILPSILFSKFHLLKNIKNGQVLSSNFTKMKYQKPIPFSQIQEIVVK